MTPYHENPFHHMGFPLHPGYQPYYCEENIYRLAAALAAEHHEADHSVLFISNPHQTCALMHQRAAPPGQIIVWDYHVALLLTGGREHWIADLDTRLGAVTPAGRYLQQTFGMVVAPHLRPWFRKVPMAEFLSTFSTDRRHMWLTDAWVQPPPSWEPPCGPQARSSHELPRFLDTTHDGPGQLFTLPELAQQLSITIGVPAPHRAPRR